MNLHERTMNELSTRGFKRAGRWEYTRSTSKMYSVLEFWFNPDTKRELLVTIHHDGEPAAVSVWSSVDKPHTANTWEALETGLNALCA